MWRAKDNRIILIRISVEYTSFLRNEIDRRIPVEHVGRNNLPRPYIGILITAGDYKYVIPLSSPKPKHMKMHNSVDFHKINDGIYGAINFNNMFPIIDNEDVYEVVETTLDGSLSNEELQYRNLIRNQLTWLNIQKNKSTVIAKAEKLHDYYSKGNLNHHVRDRCCNFIELEKHYLEYQNTLLLNDKIEN